jgi:hypothetical protein
MIFIEDQFPDLLQNAVNFKKTPTFTLGFKASGATAFDLSGSSGAFKFPTGGVTGAFSITAANSKINAPVSTNTPVAVNSTATLTAAQVASGYITSTSAAAVTMTLPTGTLLGAALGAVQGSCFDLTIDNTAGANTVTVAVAVNGILSALAVANAGSAGLLTIPSGVTGQGQFQLMFSSPTAYTFSRVA